MAATILSIGADMLDSDGISGMSGKTPVENDSAVFIVPIFLFTVEMLKFRLNRRPVEA